MFSRELFFNTRELFVPRQSIARLVIIIAISYEGEARANILSLLGSFALMIGTLASIRNY